MRAPVLSTALRRNIGCGAKTSAESAVRHGWGWRGRVTSTAIGHRKEE
jgi:hypothetical protein